MSNVERQLGVANGGGCESFEEAKRSFLLLSMYMAADARAPAIQFIKITIGGSKDEQSRASEDSQ